MQPKKDIKKIITNDKDWYKKIWTLRSKDASWCEDTATQVNFIWDVLALKGDETVLDLACGFGRHSLELAKRGCKVTGVDITPDYVSDAKKTAEEMNLDAEFICSDIRSLNINRKFDVVLNMADGAIGYLENEAENVKVFDIISASLKPGGKHLIDIGNAGYAAAHFPSRHWEFGNKSLALADFEWDKENSEMWYSGCSFKYGEVLNKPEEFRINPIKLYALDELSSIFEKRGMKITAAYGDFDKNTKATDDVFQMQVVSQKVL